MMPNRFQKQQPKQREKDDNCVVDIKKTKTGKRIQFKGKCSREQLKLSSQEAGIDLGED